MLQIKIATKVIYKYNLKKNVFCRIANKQKTIIKMYILIGIFLRKKT